MGENVCTCAQQGVGGWGWESVCVCEPVCACTGGGRWVRGAVGVGYGSEGWR